MANFKEIVTKTVVGKAKKTTSSSFQITPNETPNTVLGCWVINHTFRGVNNNGSVLIDGSFDVNVWYSYDNDTKTTVTTQRFGYNDKMNVRLLENNKVTDSSEIIVRSLKQPTVTNVTAENGIVKLDIEKELGVEVVGDTKIKVTVEDDEDDYEEIIDEIDETEESQINEVTDDYLN